MSGNATFSSTESDLIQLACWYTVPICSLRNCARSSSEVPAYRSFPKKITLPFVGGSRPRSTCKSVDFPHPDGPKITKKSSLEIENRISFSTRIVCSRISKAFTTPSIWITASFASFAFPVPDTVPSAFETCGFDETTCSGNTGVLETCTCGWIC